MRWRCAADRGTPRKRERGIHIGGLVGGRGSNGADKLEDLQPAASTAGKPSASARRWRTSLIWFTRFRWIAVGGLESIPVRDLREDVTALNHHIGAARGLHRPGFHAGHKARVGTTRAERGYYHSRRAALGLHGGAAQARMKNRRS